MSEFNLKQDYDFLIADCLTRLIDEELNEDVDRHLDVYKPIVDEAISVIKQQSLEGLIHKVHEVADFLFRSFKMANIFFQEECVEKVRVFNRCHFYSLTEVWEAIEEKNTEKVRSILIHILEDDEPNRLFFPFYRQIVNILVRE
ncbi:hypothetical protein HPT25_22780 [Bacillus sp. BRMEA1]|uniref:hypothetical protein n=1 Tax=Neobacillus endophyticus TaxID=2738405 RepID=UPI001566B56A|nr:hypothetical protein [Neobacillus endophyticus]NRD80165.1 hypothetical protein [Neobacillus endophyticus]